MPRPSLTMLENFRLSFARRMIPKAKMATMKMIATLGAQSAIAKATTVMMKPMIRDGDIFQR
jgi:hypothetical protein